MNATATAVPASGTMTGVDQRLDALLAALIGDLEEARLLLPVVRAQRRQGAGRPEQLDEAAILAVLRVLDHGPKAVELLRQRCGSTAKQAQAATPARAATPAQAATPAPPRSARTPAPTKTRRTAKAKKRRARAPARATVDGSKLAPPIQPPPPAERKTRTVEAEPAPATPGASQARTDTPCPRCGEPMPPLVSKGRARVYCSDLCRKSAHRERLARRSSR